MHMYTQMVHLVDDLITIWFTKVLATSHCRWCDNHTYIRCFIAQYIIGSNG